MMLAKLLCSGFVVLIPKLMTVTVTGHPVGENDSVSPVTEHFSKSQPGTVPRIPASLFSSFQDFGSVFEVNTSSSVESDIKSYDSENKNSLEKDVKSFTAYPLPPSSLILTHSQPSNNDPVDNLHDFSSRKKSNMFNKTLIDSQTDEDETVIDQIAVESELIEQTSASRIISTVSTTPYPKSTFILKTYHKTPIRSDQMRQKEVKDNDFVITSLKIEKEDSVQVETLATTMSSEVDFQLNSNSETITHKIHEMINDNQTSDELNSEFNSEFPIDVLYDSFDQDSIVTKKAEFEDGVSNNQTNILDRQHLSTVTYPNISEHQELTVTKVLNHHTFNVSKIKNQISILEASYTSGEANEDQSEEATSKHLNDSQKKLLTTTSYPVQKSFLKNNTIFHEVENLELSTTIGPPSFEMLPKLKPIEEEDNVDINITDKVEEISTITPLNNTRDIEKPPTVTPQKTIEDFIDNGKGFANEVNRDMGVDASDNEKEDSRELETMYYSDSFAITTIQPVHEVTFYATTLDYNSDEELIVRVKERNFNLLKEDSKTPSYNVDETVEAINDYVLNGETESENDSEVTTLQSINSNANVSFAKENIFFDDMANKSNNLETILEPISNKKHSEKKPNISDQRDPTTVSDVVKIEFTHPTPETSAEEPTTSNHDIQILTSNSSDSDEETEISCPLITLMNIQPHSMKLMIKPSEFHANTEITLQYERIPQNRQPEKAHSDNPVKETIIMYNHYQEYELSDLPEGKYIVCGNAKAQGSVFQTSCFEATITKLNHSTLQSGVLAVIIVAILIFIFVAVFTVLQKFASSRKKKQEREFKAKVDQFARKEKERQEKSLQENQELALTFPELNEPYEERCIM